MTHNVQLNKNKTFGSVFIFNGIDAEFCVCTQQLSYSVRF